MKDKVKRLEIEGENFKKPCPVLHLMTEAMLSVDKGFRDTL
jgi:hypothetical protein